MQSFTILLSLAALTSAITVTYPTQTTLWDSSKDQTITWSSVSTDPETMDIYLAHMASQPPTTDLLFSNVKVSDGKVSVNKLQFPAGTAYQINFVKPNSPEQLFAQSNQFNITGASTDATSTLPGYTGPTASPSTSASTSTSTKTSSESGSAVLTTTSTGTASTTLSTSTGSATDSATTTDSTASATPSGTAAVNGTSTASATPSSSSSAAVGNVVSGSFAAVVVGAMALFI